MKLRVLIVDDEELARSRLRVLLADCVEPSAEVAGEVASATAALDWLRRQPADVLLLDIHMPGLDGLQLARRLRQLPAMPLVIFVTAHAEHALAAFEVEAVDYLTKPVRRLRLQEALTRAAQRLSLTPASASSFAATQPVGFAPTQPAGFAPTQPARWAATQPLGLTGAASMPAELPDDQVIVVPERGGLVRVPLAQVLYLKAELKYVTVRTACTSHLIEASLTELEPRLGPRFVRIHRNAIVARRAVRALQRRSLTTNLSPLDGAESGDGWAVWVEPLGEWLAVSRRQLAAVREALAGAGL